MQLQALCIISYPLVNSNLGYSPEMLNSVQNRRFFSRMTLKLDGWPWKTIGHLLSLLLQALCSILYPLVNSNWSYSPEMANLGQIRRFLASCDLELWPMTLKDNRAPLLGNIKLYISFNHHMWIQTGVTVRKRLSWVVTSVTLKVKLQGHTAKNLSILTQIGCFRTVTPVWIHKWLPNDAQSLK